MTTATQIERLVEQRQRAWNEANELLDRAKRERRELTAEEHGKFERICSELDTAADVINGLRAQRDREVDSERARAPFASVVAPASYSAGDTEARAFFAGERGTSMDLARPEVRDLLKVTTTTGGHLVPTGFSGAIYESILETSPIRGLATVIRTPAGESLDWPTVSAHGTAAIVGEGTALAEADPAYSKVTFGAYKYGQLLQVSNELLSDNAVVGFEAHLGREFGLALARASGSVLITGTGTNQPLGIVNGGYGTATGQTGSTGVPSYSNLVDVVHTITPSYRRNASWIVSDGFHKAVRKLTDSTGQPLWGPSMSAGAPDTLLGYPIFVDPHVTAPGTGIVSAAYGDWSRAFGVREAGPLRVERSNDFAFEKDLVTFRAIERVDGRAIDVAAAVLYKGGAS